MTTTTKLKNLSRHTEIVMLIASLREEMFICVPQEKK